MWKDGQPTLTEWLKRAAFCPCDCYVFAIHVLLASIRITLILAFTLTWLHALGQGNVRESLSLTFWLDSECLKELRFIYLFAGWRWRRPKPLRSSQENTVNARWRLPVCVQMQTQVWARRIKKDSSLERNDWAVCNFEWSARWPLPPTAIARSFIYTVFTHAWWQPLSMCKRSP